MSSMFPIAVLISGNGSNLQAIIDHIEAGELAAQIKLVISDHADAYGLVRARQYQIPTAVISANDYPKRGDFDAVLKERLVAAEVNLIVLSGFMRVLSAEFVDYFQGKIINIHPSLLPKYRGLNTYQQAIAAGDKEHGSTVHWVTAQLDSGPIIAQQRLAILPDDTPESLKQRTQQLEHRLYSQAIQQLIDMLK